MKQFWNNTKVVCTIGPACADRPMLKKMMLAGMDIARINFSHGSIEEQAQKIKLVRAVAAELGLPVAVLQDLPGPKIRIGALEKPYIDLQKGQKFFLTTRKILGTGEGVSVNHPQFVRGLKAGQLVYLNDALVKMEVLSRTADKVFCRVISAGRIYPKKGISSPSRFFNINTITPYDIKCLDAGLAAGVDFVAVSFVQHSRDIAWVKNYLRKKGKHVFVIAKIERKAAFEDIDNIIALSDGVMVARGDLGIEAELSEVPFLQKELIRKCNQQGRPVITATQMLESMVLNPQPTRAEVSDIANAILDGTDAVMLSEETAVGKFPLETLRVMLKVAHESDRNFRVFHLAPRVRSDKCVSASLGYAAVDIAENSRAKAIIAPTNNIDTIGWLSRWRPNCPIIGITSDKEVYKKMILFWGVYPLLVKKFNSLPETLRESLAAAKTKASLKKNDNVVILLTKDNLIYDSDIMEVRKL